MKTCPKCDKQTLNQVKLGGWWNERWEWQCRCGYNSDTYDPNSTEAITVTIDALKTAHVKVDRRTIDDTKESRERRRQERIEEGG
jgi:hypothetical protein